MKVKLEKKWSVGDFRRAVLEKFEIPADSSVVITNTDRKEIDDASFGDLQLVSFFPGDPNSIFVPEGDIEIANGTPIKVPVELRDIGGNVSEETDVDVMCKLSGFPSLPVYSAHCSAGKGMLTGEPLFVEGATSQLDLEATFSVPGFEKIAVVTRVVKVTTRPVTVSCDQTRNQSMSNVDAADLPSGASVAQVEDSDDSGDLDKIEHARSIKVLMDALVQSRDNEAQMARRLFRLAKKAGRRAKKLTQILKNAEHELRKFDSDSDDSEPDNSSKRFCSH